MTREEAIQVLNMVEAHGLADEAKRIAIESLSADVVRIEVYRDLYEKYIDLKHKTEWIPCSERLPSKGRYYLCCNKGCLPFIAHYFDGQWHCFDETTALVDAWMPLPTPYGKENEE